MLLSKKWNSALEAFKAAYAHERFITAKINDLMTLAIAEKDYAAQVMLNWFVAEQVEEEDSALKIVQLLEKCRTFRPGLDHWLTVNWKKNIIQERTIK
jgi:ferritin